MEIKTDEKRLLIALDMDGTLIGENGISKEDKAAILKAKEAGHVVAIVSGRSDDSVLELLEKEGLADLPVSGSNGAITLVNGIEIDRVSMPEQLVKTLFDYLDGNSYPFLIYTSTGVYSKHNFLELVKEEFATSPGAKGSPFESYEFMAEYSVNHGVITFEELSEVLKEGTDVFKIFVFLPNPKKKEICSDFALNIDDVMLTSSYVDNISISSGNGHKGTGLIALANHFKIPLSNTVAVGDNLNDLGMLKIAGLSVAMENAEQEIKEAVDVVTLSNLESGVAYAIENYILNFRSGE